MIIMMFKIAGPMIFDADGRKHQPGETFIRNRTARGLDRGGALFE
jgi:hypothetical protein